MVKIQSIPDIEEKMEVKLGDIQSNSFYHSPSTSSTTNENLDITTDTGMTTN